MFIPVGDSPNPPGRPWVTYGLIAINVLVFVALLPLGARAPSPEDADFLRYLSVIADEHGLDLAQVRELARSVSAYDVFTFRHGWKPAAPSLGSMLWSMFLHGGIVHLVGNMLFLWIYGDNVEHRLGRAGFLAAYLGTGMLACGGDALLRLGSSVPSIGASGAISGVLGLYFVWFPRNRIRVWIFLFPFFMDIIELRARVVLGLYVILQNLLPLLLTAGQGGVSHGAHLGGFLAGGALALMLDRRLQARPEPDVRRQPPTQGVKMDPVSAMRSALMGYFIDPHGHSPGQENRSVPAFVSAWRLVHPTDKNYTAFIHLVDAEGNIIAQADHQLWAWDVTTEGATSMWKPDIPHLDMIPIPENVLSVSVPVTIRLGVWLPDTGQHFLVETSTLEVDAGGRLVIGELGR